MGDWDGAMHRQLRVSVDPLTQAGGDPVGAVWHQFGAVRRRAEWLLRETRPDELSPREALCLLSRLKGPVAEQAGRDGFPGRR